MTTCPCGAQTGRVLAKYCDGCRWRHRGKRCTYPLTAERRAYVLAQYDSTERRCSDRLARVLGVPPWRVRRWASEMGLATPATRPQRWTPEQDAFLEAHAGTRHPNWIAKQLKRSLTAVTVRMKRLELSRRDARDWWTARQVALGFGVDPTTVTRWIAQSKLRAVTFGKDHPDRHHEYQIWPADVWTFVSDHPTAFTLAKVDQVWFLDLAMNQPKARKVAA